MPATWMTTLPCPEKSLMYSPENCNTGCLLSSVNLYTYEISRATGIYSKSVIIPFTRHWLLHLTRLTEQIRALRWEWYHAKFQRKERKTPTNPKGRHTNDAQSPSIRNLWCHWAAVLQEAKQRWSKEMIQEQAWLLAAYHHVGSMQVPHWVKEEVYTYMEQCTWQKVMLMLALTCIMTRMYQCSGYWAPERGIIWEMDLATEDSSETDESTDCNDSDEPEDW